VIVLINFERNRQSSTHENPREVDLTANFDTSRYNRYVGYDDLKSFKNMVVKLYIDTKKSGMFIDKPIPSPSKPEIDKFQDVIGNIQNVDDRNVLYSMVGKLISTSTVDFSNFGGISDVQVVSDTMYDILQDAKQKGALSNMLKNSVITLVCWFIRFSNSKIDNILYIGTPSKNEIYWLYIMQRLGCRVTTVSYVDDTAKYLKTDTQGKYSNVILGNKFNPINIDFKEVNTDEYLFDDKTKAITSKSCGLTVTRLDMSSSNNIESELEMLRGSRLGAIPNVNEPTYFVYLSGFVEEDAYRNRLFNIWKDVTNSPKPIILIKNGLEKPTYDEGIRYYSISRNNAYSMILSFVDTLEVSTSNDRTILAKKKFIEIAMEQKDNLSTNALFTLCVNVCVWFKQCTDLIDFTCSDIPVFFFYGEVNSHEFALMELLSAVGFDILIACPDKSKLDSVQRLDVSKCVQVFEYPNSGSIKEFPNQIVRAKLSTTAYNTSRDLDTILYNDGNMFRDRQYHFCQTVTLRTTFEEISLLWTADSKYRPGFHSDENTVTVPNIFAKIEGVPYGDTGKYWKDIQSMLTPNTVFFRLTPFFKPTYGQTDFSGYFNGNRLDLARIKGNPNVNHYMHLPDHIQDFIFQKMQEVVDSGYLKVQYPDIMHLLIRVGTTLPNNILELVQNFDFTKEIPKLVVIHVSKNQFSVYECIQLLLLNFLGFDILIYTPTGYRNIENFIDLRAFESYNVGEYQYNIAPPNMRIPKPKSKKFSFFKKK
jgi:hypothetical protein